MAVFPTAFEMSWGLAKRRSDRSTSHAWIVIDHEYLFRAEVARGAEPGRGRWVVACAKVPAGGGRDGGGGQQEWTAHEADERENAGQDDDGCSPACATGDMAARPSATRKPAMKMDRCVSRQSSSEAVVWTTPLNLIGSCSSPPPGPIRYVG